MAGKTVKDLSKDLGFSVEKVQEKLTGIGLTGFDQNTVISESEQEKLINSLNSNCDKFNEFNEFNNPIRLEVISTAKVTNTSGEEKTINVATRKKHTFEKPQTSALKDKIVSKRRVNAKKELSIFLRHNKCVGVESINFEKIIKFDDSGNIVELNLSGLNLRTLEKLDNLPLTCLIRLDLSWNNLLVLRIKNNLPFIKEINVEGNKLKGIVVSSGLRSFESIVNVDFKDIVKIELNKNNFTEFDFNKKFNSLKKFIMCDNGSKIKELKIDGDMPLIEDMILVSSNIESFIFPEFKENLSILDIRKNNINYLKLPYRIFEKNKYDKYLSIVIDENPLPDLFLSALKKPTVEEKYKELRDIFFETITVNKVKLIFLGNTGVGKTTLYKVLKFDEVDYIDQNGDSTEGVNIFNYKFSVNADKGLESSLIEVKGYDFGGQDYYHNTHYSYFSSNALYILLWGNGQYIYHRSYFNRSNSKNACSREITYPLNYWLGSVLFFTKNDINLKNSNIKLHLIQNPLRSINGSLHNNFELNRVDLSKKYFFINGFNDCDPLSSENFSEYSGNVRSMLNSMIENYVKPQSYPRILAVVEEAIRNKFNNIIVSVSEIKILFNEVNEKIKWDGDFEQILEWLDVTMSVYWISEENLNKINKVDRAACDGIKATPYDLRLLDYEEHNIVDTKKKTFYCNEITQKNFFLSSDHSEILKNYVILDIERINEIIHQILIGTSKNNGVNKKGYYTKSDFENNENFRNNRELMDYVFAFMLYNKISFEAPNKNNEDKEFYIAPSYLSDNLTLAEELFLDSFDFPIVEYRFDDFYHVNVFTEVLVRFKQNLSNNNSLKSIDYLLWKNKAILFDSAPNLNDVAFYRNSKPKMQPLIYLEFDLGEIVTEDLNLNIDDHSNLRKPTIRISTYSKNSLTDSAIFIKEIIDFIDKELVGYNYSKFALAPNQIDYVDVKAIEQDCLNKNGSSTGLFTYNNHLYRFSDFSLFTNKKSAMKKIFISHSTEDYRELQNFTTHLHPLKRTGLIDHWHCSQLVVGDKWDSSIQEKLWESDIICMLISPSWLANEYIFDKELKTALERKERFKYNSQGKDIVIFPIIVKSCSWHLIEALSTIQAAPQKAKTISSYADQNEAWSDVIRKLIDILKRMDDPEYIPLIGERLGRLYMEQYAGNLSKIN